MPDQSFVNSLKGAKPDEVDALAAHLRSAFGPLEACGSHTEANVAELMRMSSQPQHPPQNRTILQELAVKISIDMLLRPRER